MPNPAQKTPSTLPGVAERCPHAPAQWGGLGMALEHPALANLIRLCLVVIVALGGYLWKTEMAHIERTLSEIRQRVVENDARQWRETNAIRGEVSRLGSEMHRAALETQRLLLTAPTPSLRQRPAAPR